MVVASPARARPDQTVGTGQPSRYRPEIQGLRTVAALLVAVYHIWFDRVSGGVDVFFVVSGFLLTGSLVRQAGTTGRVPVVAHLTRIARRIVPAAYLVLAVTAVGTILVISRVFWQDVLGDLLAAALYGANWHFAEQSVDYLAQDRSQSPALHFWALSIQGQVYVLLPLFLVAVTAAARRMGAKVADVALAALVVVVVASFARALAATAADHSSAYFSTAARLWEFALGGVLALSLHRIRLPAAVRWLLGWAGLVAIVGVGAVLDVGAGFPGWPALAPTLGAVAVIVAGDGRRDPEGRGSGAARLLSAPVLVRFGDVSYAFFLWHWPLFILMREQLDVDRLSVAQGTLVMLASFVAAVLTTRLVEEPVRRRGERPARRHRPTLAEVGVVALVPVGVVALSWNLTSGASPQDGSARGDPFADATGPHPGALALEPGAPVEAEGDHGFVPSLVHVRGDLPAPYGDGCHQDDVRAEVLVCEYGVPDADLTVALVGGSHSTHWQPALEVLAEVNGWRLRSYTRAVCRFALPVESTDACHRWNLDLAELLQREPPDLVVTTATIAANDGVIEFVPLTYLMMWERMGEVGVPVLALRDSVVFPFDVPACVDDHGPDDPACAVARGDFLVEPSPIDEVEDVPGNVRFLDMADHFCLAEVCPPVIGNVLVYRDAHHFTATYSRTMAGPLDRHLRDLAPHLYSR